MRHFDGFEGFGLTNFFKKQQSVLFLRLIGKHKQNGYRNDRQKETDNEPGQERPAHCFCQVSGDCRKYGQCRKKHGCQKEKAHEGLIQYANLKDKGMCQEAILR
jgi:hypothetical protein